MIIFILRHTQKAWLRFLPFFIITIVSYVNKTYIPSVYIIYALCFYINFLIVLSLKNKGLIIGFSLFALCDAAVAFNYISPNRTICSVIWLLYGASQLMIISSSLSPKAFCLTQRNVIMVCHNRYNINPIINKLFICFRNYFVPSAASFL